MAFSSAFHGPTSWLLRSFRVTRTVSVTVVSFFVATTTGRPSRSSLSRIPVQPPSARRQRIAFRYEPDFGDSMSPSYSGQDTGISITVVNVIKPVS